MKTYNKLVRDKIPEIIKADGQKPKYKHLLLSGDELKKKLREEVYEFLASDDVEELADILEVVFALSSEVCLKSKEELLEIYQKKHDEKGGFSQKIFLISVEDK